MKHYKSLGPSEIRERIAATLYLLTAGHPRPKLAFDMLEDGVKEHWRQRAKETVDLSANIILNIGPANFIHAVADAIWSHHKKLSSHFHDAANLLDENI